MESKPFKSVDDQIVILREREWKSGVIGHYVLLEC